MCLDNIWNNDHVHLVGYDYSKFVFIFINLHKFHFVVCCFLTKLSTVDWWFDDEYKIKYIVILLIIKWGMDQLYNAHRHTVRCSYNEDTFLQNPRYRYSIVCLWGPDMGSLSCNQSLDLYSLLWCQCCMPWHTLLYLVRTVPNCNL